MIKTEANSQSAYLKMLNEYDIPTMQEAKAKGLIQSFTMMKGSFANDDDINVLLMIKYERMAMMDPDDERDALWDSINDAITEKLGGQEKVKEMVGSYGNIREFHGQKLMREVLVK